MASIVHRLHYRTMASLAKKIISTPNAPAAIGPYSQAVQVGNTLYISGQLGLLPETGVFVGPMVREQTEQSLKNIGAILKAAGGSFENVVKTTVLLADMNEFTVVNDVYKSFFTKDFPARAAYQVTALPKNGRVEIEAVAVLDSNK
ncbi:hypothetical protein AB6A40_006988 [Gnathostoma spinigerum]|uniref:Uncharacterized protein n=1 Tax=Gnathostoma spinigerum TaxID=75299 RepID=A0ABD6EJY6_9BILA